MIVCNGTYFTVLVTIIDGEKVIANNITIQPEESKTINCSDLTSGKISLCDNYCQHQNDRYQILPGRALHIKEGRHEIRINNEIDSHF